MSAACDLIEANSESSYETAACCNLQAAGVTHTALRWLQDLLKRRQALSYIKKKEKQLRIHLWDKQECECLY